MDSRGTVGITKRGRAAILHYSEGPERTFDFDAELGGGDVLVVIYAPAPEAWAARLPWAAGRRDAVLTRVAREVMRREAGGSRFRIHAGGVDILER